MSDKPRVRVAAGSRPSGSSRQSAGYLRDTRSGIISTRPAVLRDHRDEVRAVWQRSAGLALDLIQNSGRLRGAADQVIADTVGSELVLNPQPRLAGLGYTDEEARAFVSEVKAWWKLWSWTPAECDLRGKLTVPQMIDVALRWDMAFGEVLGLVSYMWPGPRARYRIATGTKICMVNPNRLVQDTNDLERMFQGVLTDEFGRPKAYRLREKEGSITGTRDYPARDLRGLPVAFHVFDAVDAADVRGISRLAGAFRKHIQHETLVDATIQTSILQTIFGIALTSPSPSKDAFEAMTALGDEGVVGGLDESFRDYFLATLDKAAEGKISISGEPTVSHLAPGEDLKFLTSGTPGPQFLPVSAELSRDMARAIGITYGGFTLDHSAATYSSVRMDNASIWPVVVRRRERIAAPVAQTIFEAALDEAIGSERIPFKGGYEAFAANRDKVCWALWQGPAKPSADDGKSAKAATERLQNGTSTLAAECAELGYDPEEVFEQRLREHRRYVEAKMPSPFERVKGGGAQDTSAQDDPAAARGTA